MFKKIASQTPTPGKIQRYELKELRSKHGVMVLHVEHLGRENKTFWADTIASAQVQEDALLAPKKRKPGELTVEEFDQLWDGVRARRRPLAAKHGVRKLENVFHDDGTEATEADIAEVVNSLPDDAFDRLWDYIDNVNNFREYPIQGDPVEIAKK